MVLGTVTPCTDGASFPVTGHSSDRRVVTAVTGLASVEQHRTAVEQHENDERQGRMPDHVPERQLEAVPDEPEEQHVDVLQVFPHRLWR